MSKTAYKRILIVNDDDKLEEFLVKYGIEEELKEDIVYCESIEEALECVMNQGKFYCDKILLDIKIQWPDESRYNEEIRKYIDLERMDGKYGGFILFMYLLTKGFPIDRIAFLSAYIVPIDSEEKEKLAILKFMETVKKRDKNMDGKIREMSTAIPSMKKRIEEILDLFTSEESSVSKDLKPYREIKEILKQDLSISNEQIANERESEAKNAARDFLDKIAAVGLNIENKIPKGGGANEKLKEWLTELDETQIDRYYKFRCAALNICDSMITYYERLEKEKEALEREKYDTLKERGIYSYTKIKQFKDVLEKYPPRYFVGMLERVKNVLTINVDTNKLSDISSHVVDNLIGYWEALSVYYSDEDEKRQKSSATMVMKFTRNWKMHNLIKNTDIRFMYFVFLISVRLLIEEEEKEIQFWEKRITQCFGLEESPAGERKTAAKDIFMELNRKLNRKPYEINLYRLFDAYGKSESLKQSIMEKDIYKIFYMSIHCPHVEVSSGESELKLIFYLEGKWENDWLWKELENFAFSQIKNA